MQPQRDLAVTAQYEWREEMGPEPLGQNIFYCTLMLGAGKSPMISVICFISDEESASTLSYTERETDDLKHKGFFTSFSEIFQIHTARGIVQATSPVLHC